MAEYIERELALMKIMQDGCSVSNIAVLKSIPAADVELVRHGRWETANDGTHFCSHCGCDAPYTWDDIDRNYINSADDVPDRISNYCPNCGADMRGDKSANK